METRFCRFCDVEHPATEAFWYRNGAYFKCRKHFSAKSAERFRKKKAGLYAQPFKKCWVPTNWPEVCATLLDELTRARERQFLFSIRKKQKLTERQWEWFVQLYLQHVGVLGFDLSTKPSSKPVDLPNIDPFMVTRFKPKEDQIGRYWVDTDGFLHHRKKPKDFHR